MIINCRGKRRQVEASRSVSRVTLNGRAVEDCFYLDTRRGVVRHYVRDASGRLVVDFVTGRLVTAERRGNVRYWVGPKS